MLFFLLIAFAMEPQAGASAGPSPEATSTYAPIPTATTLDDPAVTARAKEWFHRAQTGDIDRTQLDDAMNAALTDDFVKQTAARLGPLGAPLSFTYLKTFKADDGSSSTAFYRVALSSGTVLWTFALDKSGLIAGFYVRPDSTLF